MFDPDPKSPLANSTTQGSASPHPAAAPAAHTPIDGGPLIGALRTAITEELGSFSAAWSKKLLDKVVGLIDLTPSSSASTEADLWTARSAVRSIAFLQRDHEKRSCAEPSFLQRAATWVNNLFGRGAPPSSRMCSPLDNLLSGMEQLEKLQSAVKARGETLPPSMCTVDIALQKGCFHPLMQQVVVDRILKETASSKLVGAIPALFNVICSSGPSRFNYQTNFSERSQHEVQKRVSRGVEELQSLFQSQSYQTISKIVQDSTLQLGDQCLEVLSIRQLGDVPPSRDGELSEAAGKNLALCLEVMYPDGKRGSFILKKQPDSTYFDSFATSFNKALGVQSYSTHDLPGGWLAIEKLNAATLAYCNMTETFLQNQDTMMRFQQLSSDKKAAFLNELGKIFAIEYALDVRDCKAKHILFDRISERPFRIDWEYMFQFDQPANHTIPAYPGPCEKELIECLIAGPDKETLMTAIEQGFTQGCSEMKAALKDPHSQIAQLLSQTYPEQASLYQTQILTRIDQPPPPIRSAAHSSL